MNIYTTPITEKPDYRKVGVLACYDYRTNNLYPIGKIIYEHFWNEEYQYIFILDWDKIDSLPSGIPTVIPGLDLDLRKDTYYRVNMIPGFMQSRSPNRNRVNLMEMMNSVGLKEYDRFEYILRSNKITNTDNIVVLKPEEVGVITTLDDYYKRTDKYLNASNSPTSNKEAVSKFEH